MKYDLDYAKRVLEGDCRALLFALENGHDITAQMRRVRDSITYIERGRTEREVA